MTIDPTALATHISAFFAGIVAMWAWLRHALGYLSPIEAEVAAKLREITAQLQSRPAAQAPPSPQPGQPPASSAAASAAPGATMPTPIALPLHTMSPEFAAALVKAMQQHEAPSAAPKA